MYSTWPNLDTKTIHQQVLKWINERNNGLQSQN
ncbi:unnamed protein product, partial [Rotaria socialis]